MSLYDPEAGYVWPDRVLALNCLLEMEKGRNGSALRRPPCLETLAQRYGCRVLHYVSCPADASDARARRLAANQLWVRDGLMMAVRLLSAMKRSGRSLQQLLRQLPDFATTSRIVPCADNPGRVLRRLAQDGQEHVGEGRPGPHEKRRDFRASGQAGTELDTDGGGHGYGDGRRALRRAAAEAGHASP